MSASTAKMLKVAKEVAEDYSSSLSDLTVNSKPLINMLTMLAEENIVHAPIIVQAVERHLQKVRAEIKLPVLYLIDSIVKNVGGQYTLLFTQNIVSTFCSVFEKVDERTRAQMFKLRQTWNEVFPPKKLYAMDVRVNSIDPAWPITALPPTTNIHVNPKFIRAPGQVPNAVPAVVPSVATTPAPTVAVSATTTIVEDSHALNEKSMREELLRKQKELLELQQKKLELELLQTKAKLEEQQKQLERQTGHLHAEHIQNMLLPSLQTVAQETATKLLATAKVETPIATQKIQTAVSTSPPVIGSSQSSSTVTAAVSEATVAVASARVSSGVSGSSKVKTEGTGGVKTSVSAGSRPSSTPTITTTAPSVRSRDPRLASRQPQPVVVPVNNTSQLQDDDEMEEPDSVFEPVKLETAKPKPQITINLGCANKGTMNKETRGISKKDPRLMSNKVQGLSNSNIKGRTSSAPSSEVGGKGGSKLRKGPSPVPSSPSRTGSSGVGKTSTSPSTSSSSISSPRKTQNKSGSNGSIKALRMKPIPKLSQAIPKIKHEATDSPPTKTEVKEEVVSNKEKEKEITKTDVTCKTPSPSSKTENHKKKSSPVGISKLSPDKKKSGPGKPESVGTGGNDVINSVKKERVKSPAGGEKKHGRERSDQDRPSMIFDMFGDSSESDSPSPPPPPVISTDSKKKEEPSPSKGSMFKDVKGSKSRNYVRRNQHSKSRSPEISPVITTGDVDLRLGAPPEKHPRLNMFQSDIKPLSSPPEEDIKNQPLVEAANKDIDLRQLPGSPGKKRPSMERAEQPPLKKTKAEVFDELFGNEDVDLRQLPPAVVKPALPPSPPPPPIISQPSPIPTSSSSQDSMATISLSPKRPSPERERDRKVAEDHIDETKLVSEDNVKENEGELNLRGWAKYKELKPDTYKSPLRPLGPFGHELDLPKSQSSTPGSNSPLREREIMFSTPRSMSHFRTSKFDRLGRPLLYDRLPGSVGMTSLKQKPNKLMRDRFAIPYKKLRVVKGVSNNKKFVLFYEKFLSDDPMERRRSLSTSLGEDTDMRPHMLEDVDDIDINIEMIVQQADEQLKNGTISFPQYNTLLKQVIHLNEVQKLREAQRRDLQENKENWERSRRRRIGGVAPVDRSQLSPISVDDDSQDGSSIEGRYGDIDERFPASHKPRSSAPPPAPSPPDASMMGSNKFQSNMPHWSETRHPQMPPSQWEPLPHTWLRGDHAPPQQGPMVRMFHSAPTQVQGPGPYRPPGPEFQPMNNFGGMNRWRPPQFQNRPPFEGPMDRFEPRFAVRPEPRFRVSAPLPQPPPMPQQPPQLQPMPPHPQPMQPQLQMMPQQPQLQSLPQRPHSDELPPADPMILDLIAQDTMRTINIDGVPREIRFYGDTAVALLSWDDPREICFQGGSRRVWFDDREAVNCSFNEGYRDFILDGSPHRIQLGSPTRELYIDGKWYECFFSGPPITIEIGGKMHNVKLEGPPPHVKIDNVKRTDLVAGKINLIINARTRVPVFLDAKPQRFDIDGKPHVLRFVEALNTVLINGRALKIEFGGLPIPIIVYGKKHFIRFTVLPQGIKPGYIKIMNMEGGQLSSPPRVENENSNSMGFGGEDSNDGPAKFPQGHEPALPALGGRGTRGTRRQFAAERDRDSPQEPEHARNSPAQLPAESTVVAPAVPVQQPRQRTQGQLPLEMLTSLMPSVMAPASGFSYQVDQDSQERPQQEVPAAVVPAGVPETSVPTTGTTTIPFLPTEINVDELFQKLVATGIVPQADKAAADSKKEEEEVRSIKNVDFKQSETMKVRQPGVVALLYSGIQCSSCGVRFPPEQTMKYSQHLDWHFRQNRRDRDNTRKAQSRKWYYDVSDWIQFEEIEDLEERAQSWFETQQAAEGEEKEVQEVPSVCAGENPEDTFCAVCHDKFEQFYNEEREEWHLRAAVRIDGKTYHPLCYEDYKASLEMSTEEPPATEDTKEEEKEQAEDEQEKKEEEKKADEETKEDTKVEESNVEAMDTSVPDDTIEKEPPADGDDAKVEEGDSEKVGDIENQLKDVKLEPGEDETSQKEEAETSAEGKEPEVEVKTEPEEKETEEGAGEEGVAVAPTVDTTHAAVACSIDGNVQFEDSPQITTGSSMPGKIKINISKSLPASATKEASSEAEPEASTAEQGPDDDSGQVPTEASRESGEEGTGEEEVASQEPPPPGVEPVQLKPRLMGRKLTELPPVMKGTELSGLCSIM